MTNDWTASSVIANRSIGLELWSDYSDPIDVYGGKKHTFNGD